VARGAGAGEAARLRAAVLALPDPGPLALFDNVYAGPHTILDAERAEYAAYLSGFDEAGVGVAGTEAAR
jgi:2-oxoisovalerate dehydrogenase E1 component alpha subunit